MGCRSSRLQGETDVISWLSVRWCLALMITMAAVVSADDGQADLDKATDLKLQAKSIRDLDEVVRLCESAIQKGLDADSREFARELLTATRYQKAERIAQAIAQARQGRRAQALRKMALDDLNKVLAADPEFGEAYLLKARLLALPGGDAEQARKAADEALKRLEDPRSKARAHLVRSRTFKKVEDALADVKRAVELDPDNLEALRLWAGLLMATKRVDEAIKEMERLLKKEPGDLGVRVTLVEALISQKKYDQAIKHADELIADPDTEVAGHRMRAQIHLAREAYDKAIADIDAVLKARPNDLDSILFRARARYLQEEFAEARKDVDRVLQMAPGTAAALLLRSAIAAAQEQYPQAIRDLESVLRQSPGEASLQVQLGYYHMADDRPRKAIEIFSKVLESDEGNAAALRARGDAYLAVGKHAEAIADFEKALQSEPDNPGTLNNLAWVLATSPEDELRDGKRALELAKKACELTDYKQAHILSTLASAYAELGDFEQARKWSAKAVEQADKKSEQYEHLTKELESYKQNKPWREKQNVQEKPLEVEQDES